MSEYGTFLTTAGAAWFAARHAAGEVGVLTHVAFGDGQGTIDETRTALINEVARVDVDEVQPHETDARSYVVRAVLPTTVGQFVIREIGFFAADGTLIFVTKRRDVYKASLADHETDDLQIELTVTNTSAADVTLIADPNHFVASKAFINAKFAEAILLAGTALVRTATFELTQINNEGATS